MELWSLFSSYFWSTKFWFPPGYTWDSVKNTDNGIYHAQVADLYYVLPIAASLTVIRKIFEFFVAEPLGRSLGVKDKPSKQLQPNPVLEEAFSRKKSPEHQDIVGLSKKTGLTIRQVERWYRVKRNINKPSKLCKFTEASWRFVFYTSVFFSGLYILWDKPWFNKLENCWVGFPNHNVTADIYWYYMIEMGLYVSLMCSQFFDVRRKDFYEMLIHHLATLALLFFSWCNNFFRVGTLILCLHDANDFLLELSKMMGYLKRKQSMTIVSGLFVVVWIITRLIIFPFWIINSTMFESIGVVGMCNVYYVYNICLSLLLILHIIWFYFIVKAVYGMLFSNTHKDSRSATEDSDSCEETETYNNGAVPTPNKEK